MSLFPTFSPNYDSDCYEQTKNHTEDRSEHLRNDVVACLLVRRGDSEGRGNDGGESGHRGRAG